MKTLNGHIAAAALIGFVTLPGIALAQAEPIASVTRLVPLDITGLYVVPLIKPVLNPARYHLLTADPFKETAVIAVPSLAAGPLLPSGCVPEVRCP